MYTVSQSAQNELNTLFINSYPRLAAFHYSINFTHMLYEILCIVTVVVARVYNNRERVFERSIALHQMYSESNVTSCLVN